MFSIPLLYSKLMIQNSDLFKSSLDGDDALGI